jgi:hypothetical protein
MEMKDKMAAEKGRHGIEELRDRQNQIDSNVRQELQRKEQTLQTLQANFDAQIRAINGWLRQEEMARSQMEAQIRGEMSKVGDGVKYEVENSRSS